MSTLTRIRDAPAWPVWTSAFIRQPPRLAIAGCHDVDFRAYPWVAAGSLSQTAIEQARAAETA